MTLTSIVSIAYPAQYNASPGLLTITPRKLLFTPLASPRPKLPLGLDSICRVKKAGALNGLHVQWRGRTDEGSEEEAHVEKFLWIGGRDEVFARLVGWGGRRWTGPGVRVNHDELGQMWHTYLVHVRVDITRPTPREPIHINHTHSTEEPIEETSKIHPDQQD